MPNLRMFRIMRVLVIAFALGFGGGGRGGSLLFVQVRLIPRARQPFTLRLRYEVISPCSSLCVPPCLPGWLCVVGRFELIRPPLLQAQSASSSLNAEIASVIESLMSLPWVYADQVCGQHCHVATACVVLTVKPLSLLRICQVSAYLDSFRTKFVDAYVDGRVNTQALAASEWFSIKKAPKEVDGVYAGFEDGMWVAYLLDAHDKTQKNYLFMNSTDYDCPWLGSSTCPEYSSKNGSKGAMRVVRW